MIIITAVIVLHCMYNLCITILHLPVLYARRGVEVYCVCVYMGCFIRPHVRIFKKTPNHGEYIEQQMPVFL